MTIATMFNILILGVMLFVFIYMVRSWQKQKKVLDIIRVNLYELTETLNQREKILSAQTSYNLPPLGNFDRMFYCRCGRKLELKPKLDGLNDLWVCVECRQFYSEVDRGHLEPVFGYPEILNLKGGNHEQT